MDVLVRSEQYNSIICPAYVLNCYSVRQQVSFCVNKTKCLQDGSETL